MHRSSPTVWGIRRWTPVWASMCYCLTIGVMHCFGNLTIYFTSYMRSVGGERVRYKDVQWIYAAEGIFQGAFGFLGGYLERRVGPRLSAVVAGCIMSVGVVLSCLTVSSFWGFFLTYGVIMGIGCGLAYPIPLTVALKWHPRQKGLVSGMIFVARGLSVFIFTPLQTNYVNPLNISPEYAPFPKENPNERYFVNEALLSRVPSLFVLMGMIFIILQLASALLMPNPSKEDEEAIVADEALQSALVGEQLSLLHPIPSALPEFSILHILSTTQFWLIWMVMFFNWQAISYINGFWKVIGQEEFHMSDYSLSILGATVAVTNSIARFAWGTAGDYFGFRLTMIVFCIVYTAFLATTPVCGLFSGFKAVVLYHIWLNVLKIADGGAFTIIAPITSDTFGPRNFGPVFGLLFTARATSSLVGAKVSSCLYHLIGSQGMCLLMACCTCVSGLLVSAGHISTVKPIRAVEKPEYTKT